jgi:hypothetical protein
LIGLLIPKTRGTVLAGLSAFGVVFALAIGGFVMARMSHTVPREAAADATSKRLPVPNGSSKEIIDAYETVAKLAEKQLKGTAAKAASEVVPSAGSATAKGEDEMSQAIANRTVGILRAMINALGRALAEEERGLAAKKGVATSTDAASLVKKPAWVEAPPKITGDVFQASIVVGPYSTLAECEAKTPEAVQEALNQYAEAAVGPEVVGAIPLPEGWQKSIVVDRWEETRAFSVGPMIRLHLRLQFDAHVKIRVQEAYRQAVVGHRLQIFGVWAAVGLLLLAICFSHLKMDIATAGVYRTRLRFVTATVILAVVVVMVVRG